MKSTLEIGHSRLHLGRALRPDLFSQILRRMMLEHCKWDPQVGDESILLNQPVIVSPEIWAYLAAVSEKMAWELSGVEAELLNRPDLMAMLGMPRPLLRAVQSLDSGDNAWAVRTLRFDFHPSPHGWRVSEVNSDVPGGFTESSYFSELMAAHYPTTRPAGNPLRAWTEAMTMARGSQEIAILYAPGFMEDQQIATLLGHALRQKACAVHFVQHPARLRWRDGWAFLEEAGANVRLDAIVHFYQGEWLANLSGRSGWHHLYSPRHTMITNPGRAMLTESKRLPLIWRELDCPTDTLQSMFPECREPSAVNSLEEQDWVFKAAYSNTGDDVIMPCMLDQATCQKFRAQILRHGHNWLAQRRFVATPVESDCSQLTPCIGVYTINGKAEGAYARLARGPIVDYRAREAALLVGDIGEAL